MCTVLLNYYFSTEIQSEMYKKYICINKILETHFTFVHRQYNTFFIILSYKKWKRLSSVLTVPHFRANFPVRGNGCWSYTHGRSVARPCALSVDCVVLSCAPSTLRFTSVTQKWKKYIAAILTGYITHTLACACYQILNVWP